MANAYDWLLNIEILQGMENIPRVVGPASYEPPSSPISLLRQTDFFFFF